MKVVRGNRRMKFDRGSMIVNNVGLFLTNLDILCTKCDIILD
jgi:hypothetical protein